MKKYLNYFMNNFSKSSRYRDLESCQKELMMVQEVTTIVLPKTNIVMHTLRFWNLELERLINDFDQSNFLLIREIESLLLNAANGKDMQNLPDNLLDFLENDIDLSHLKIQLQMIPNMN